MVRNLLLVSLAALPAISSAAVMDQAEKFGYEHIHLDVGAGTTNEEWLDNSNATTVGLGGNYLFTENWLFNVITQRSFSIRMILLFALTAFCLVVVTVMELQSNSISTGYME